ncbi:MAG: O-antigen ligase family protein [Candidatus Electrothrix sp. GW3-4]|uniref:O-antigen ligase family protein n=1 Tax=Candidatus Electrothrix sp. GW3-4 TaxID=3126740 RepID=UPI0030D287D1
MLRNKVSLDEILLFFLLLLGPLAHGLVETWSITVAQLTIISLIALAVLPRVYKGELSCSRTPADIPIFLFLLSLLISYGLSVSPYASRIAISKGLSALALFFYIINTQRSQEKINRLLWLIVIFGTIYAIMGLTLINGEFLGFKIYSQRRYNISLFYVNHNHFAGYLEQVFLLAVGLAVANRGGKRILLFGMTVLIATALLFSLSRGGIIGAGGGLAFFVLTLAAIHRQKKGSLLFFSTLSLGLLLTAWFGLNPVLERLHTLKDPSLAGAVRMQVWRDTVPMLYERPFFGWGPGTFSIAFPAYQSTGFDQKLVNYAHNDYLQLAVETGVLGLIAFLSGIFVLSLFCLKGLQATQNRYWRTIGIAALAACLSILIHAVTDCNLQVPANLYLFALSAGLAVVSADNKRRRARGNNQGDSGKLSPRQKGRAVTGFVLALSMSIVIILLPFLGERNFRLAQSSLRQKKYDDALSKIDQAIRLNPDHAVFLSFKGDILRTKAIQPDTPFDIKKGIAYKEILSWYQKACRAAPTDSSYLLKKAALLEQYQKIPAAQKAYREAIQLAPMYAPPYYHVAALYLSERQLAEALPYFNRFLQLSGEKALGKVLDALWSAGGDYETQQQVVPQTASFRQAFAHYLTADGENELAAQESALAFSLEPTAQNALRHLQLLLNKKAYTVALKKAEEYLKIFPGELKMQELHASILERAGQYQEAALVYRRLIESASTEKNSRKYFIKTADLYARQKLYNKALGVLEQAVQQFPQSGTLYYALGISFRRSKRNEEALLALQRAVSLNPVSPSFRYQLGQEYRRLHLEEEALQEWEECLNITENYPPCQKGAESIRNHLKSPPMMR